MTSLTPLRRTILASLLLAPALFDAPAAIAAIQQHTFTISGNNGETGTGTFTWDDSEVPNGQPISSAGNFVPPELLSLSITISGGNVVGGTTTFTRADCTDAVAENTPDFTVDINFWCDNGTNTLYGDAEYVNDLNEGVSDLTFVPGRTSPVNRAIPALSIWGLIGLSGLLGIGALGFLKRKQDAA